MKLITNLARTNVEPLPKRTPRKPCANTLCTDGSPCSRCRGRDNRLKGLRKQNTARKRLGIRSRFSGQQGNEEYWTSSPFRCEVKSGAQCGPTATFFLACEAQSEAERPVGDTRSFQAILMPKGWGTEGLMVMRLSDWARDVEPLTREP